MLAVPCFGTSSEDLSCPQRIVLPPYLLKAAELGLFARVESFLKVYKVATWVDIEPGDLDAVGFGRHPQLLDRILRISWMDPMEFSKVWYQVEWAMGWQSSMNPTLYFDDIYAENLVFRPTEGRKIAGWGRLDEVPGKRRASPAERLAYARQFLEEKLQRRGKIRQLQLVEARSPLASPQAFIFQFEVE